MRFSHFATIFSPNIAARVLDYFFRFDDAASVLIARERLATPFLKCRHLAHATSDIARLHVPHARQAISTPPALSFGLLGVAFTPLFSVTL